MTKGIGGLGMAALCAAVALAAAVLVPAVIAAPAEGAIKIYRTNQEATLLGKIEKGTCRLKGKRGDRYFRVAAKSTNRAFEFHLTILYWQGYRNQYDFRYGSNKPGVFYLGGPGGIYSNIHDPPRTEGLPAGGVGFREGGKKISVGFLPASNGNFTRGVVLAGMMRCSG